MREPSLQCRPSSLSCQTNERRGCWECSILRGDASVRSSFDRWCLQQYEVEPSEFSLDIEETDRVSKGDSLATVGTVKMTSNGTAIVVRVPRYLSRAPPGSFSQPPSLGPPIAPSFPTYFSPSPKARGDLPCHMVIRLHCMAKPHITILRMSTEPWRAQTDALHQETPFAGLRPPFPLALHLGLQ